MQEEKKFEANAEDSSKNKKNRAGGSRRGNVSTIKFTGNCATLSCRLYDIGSGQADQYMKTVEAISEYIREEYTYGSIIRLVIETLQLPMIEEPPEDVTKDLKGNVSKLSEFMW